MTVTFSKQHPTQSHSLTRRAQTYLPKLRLDARNDVERFFRNNAPSTRDHLRLLAIAADMVQSAFAGRSQLYERLQSGEPDNMRQRLYGQSDRAALTERLLHFIHEGWDAAQKAQTTV